MWRLLLRLIAAVALTTAADAHAFLEQATPAVGGAVAASPREIRLTFSEGVELRFSGIALATIDGRRIATGPVAAAPGDNKQLVLMIPPLAPGRYRVSWHVVSVDTHRTEGEYTFTVGP